MFRVFSLFLCFFVAVHTCVKSNNCKRKGLNLHLNWNAKCCAMHETNAYAPIAILAKGSFHFSRPDHPGPPAMAAAPSGFSDVVQRYQLLEMTKVDPDYEHLYHALQAHLAALPEAVGVGTILQGNQVCAHFARHSSSSGRSPTANFACGCLRPEFVSGRRTPRDNMCYRHLRQQGLTAVIHACVRIVILLCTVTFWPGFGLSTIPSPTPEPASTTTLPACRRIQQPDQEDPPRPLQVTWPRPCASTSSTSRPTTNDGNNSTSTRLPDTERFVPAQKCLAIWAPNLLRPSPGTTIGGT